MRVLLSGLLMSVAPVALAQDRLAWEFDVPAIEQPAQLNDELAVGDASNHEWVLNLSDTLTVLSQGQSVSVPMPYGALHEGHVGENRATASGGRHMHIDFGEPGQGALIHVGLNATYGRVWTEDGEFVIQPGENGSVIMRVAPDEPFVHEPLDGSQLFRPVSQAQQAQNLDRPNAGADTFDFLYFYDFQMIDVHGWGLPDLAATDIGNLQTALTQSRVPIFADLTQLAFMDIPQAYSSHDLLVVDTGPRAGYMTGLQARVDALGIDVISLNRVSDNTRTNQSGDNDNFCGLGFVHNPLSNFTGRSHINVCHNGLTLAHETGHNMGLAHGLETDNSSGRPEAWARGFRIDSSSSSGGVFTSVMAYGSNRTPQFSDPTIRCPERGSVCGIPLDPGNTSLGSYAGEALRRWATGIPSQQVPNRRLRSSVLPTSRFVATNTAATAFMTVINPNNVAGTNCIIEHHGPYRNSFTFQRTDPGTNATVGNPNEAVTIPAGGIQTFVVSLTPGADLAGVRFAPYASCDNVPMAAVDPGLNTLDLGADAAGGPDLIALSATIGNTGIVEVPDGRRGVFSVATINIGGAGDVTVRAQSLAPGLPATGQVCQTNPQGACLAAPADSLTLNIGANDTPTFGVFVRTNFATPFSARERFQFQMEVGGQTRGSTSVAVRDGGAIVAPGNADHAFTVRAFDEATGQLANHATGYFDRFEIVSQPGGGTLALNGSTGVYTYTAGATAGGDTFTYRAGNSAGWSPTQTATVTITALPVPSVTAFTLEEDTDGTFTVDLDDHADANIEIDRFVLTTPPSGTHTFDPLTGVISGPLPSSVGNYGFSFAAENRSGQSASMSGTFNVVAYDSCAPRDSTPGRISRRAGAVAGFTADGSATRDEAALLAAPLCMTVTENSTAFGGLVRMENDALGLRFAIQLVSNATRYRFYLSTSFNRNPNGWDYIFDMCEDAQTGRLTTC
ncbi:Ig-like domain-containing protein [Hyphobacterium sp.]|uniref:Ig-like domain-containing protein n=1 Tax=Hyphobacterium sp. TaxID=2004662 RepID=UPI003BAD34FC